MALSGSLGTADGPDNPRRPEAVENTGFFASKNRRCQEKTLHLRRAIGCAVKTGAKSAEIVLAPGAAQGRFRRSTGMRTRW